MTQEEKDLLLKDLSARLPYKVVVTDGVEDYVLTSPFLYRYLEMGCKPYLRPMSSMTEEEFNELHKLCPHSVFNATNVPGWIVGINGSDYGRIARVNEMSNLIDYLNKHHFDYRGLIPMGLAIEAPEKMYE